MNKKECMIDKEFIESWSVKYDTEETKKFRDLYEQIMNKLKELFPDGKIRHITLDILRDIVRWKAPRVIRRALNNSEEFVKEVTTHFASSKNEQFKIEVLMLLKGVGQRVATAILHFCFPSEYTVMDFRAWWTLQQHNCLPKDYPIKNDFEHWQEYLKVCRKIRKRCDCSLRKLDKALWQYSKEKQNK
ncbi:MAG: hypothetical protein V1674_03120 [Candidatus Omnitrophota bacterium]